MMLREGHLDALARASRETFVDRMIDHLGRPDARALVEQAIDAAEDVAIVSEAGICRYVELWLAHGVMCDRGSVEMLAVLDDGALDEAGKLDAIEELVRG